MDIILTEDEAKKNWCPLARACDTHGDSRIAINRAGNAPDPDCLCIASACMAWRKHGQIGIGPNGEKRDRDMDGRTRWVDRGYCGAFGHPLAQSIGIRE